MGLKFFVHPLFALFGVFYAVTGQLYFFAIYSLCALIHELGHAYRAEKEGYRLKKVILMPFGAVVTGDTSDMTLKEDIRISLAGPLLSLSLGFAVVSLWWIYPPSYAFTDLLAEANLSIGVVNLLPVLPLDGGRVLLAVISLKAGRKKGRKICKIIGYALSGVLLVLAVLTAVFYGNFSFLCFAVFVFVGQFFSFKETNYVNLYTGVGERRLKKGMECKKFALSEDATLRTALKMLSNDYVSEFGVFRNGKEIAVLSESQLIKLAENGNVDHTIGGTLKNA